MRSYPAETASFGYALSDRSVYQAQLMSPPGNDTQLCTFPSDLLDHASNASGSGRRIALFVSLGGCDTATKVEVALEIHKRISNLVRFVVFYNDDPTNQKEIVELEGPSSTSFQEDLDEMSFSVVSTSTGKTILERIQDHASITGSTPNFLGPGSDGWQLHMFMETYQEGDIRFRTTSGGEGYRDSFAWYRVVLFSLLVISPCIRAMFLWWTGGGRIRLQRNEQGRVVGLLYIPPMSHWFVSHGTEEAKPIADTLTSEQVMALPEITYKPPTVEESNTNDSSNENASPVNPDETPTSSQRDDKRLVKIVYRASKSFNSAHPLEHADAGAELTTTCTTCSVCIEDYEVGERIRLLPCGHAFHTECISPWLTRRQGCCPLCKVCVMGEDKEEMAVDEESQEVMDMAQVPSDLNVSRQDDSQDAV